MEHVELQGAFCSVLPSSEFNSAHEGATKPVGDGCRLLPTAPTGTATALRSARVPLSICHSQIRSLVNENSSLARRPLYWTPLSRVHSGTARPHSGLSGFPNPAQLLRSFVIVTQLFDTIEGLTQEVMGASGR